MDGVMPIGRGEYVSARKREFPHAEADVSGPFDGAGAAYTELARILPFYPDAELWVQRRVGRSLPVAVPRRCPPFGPIGQALSYVRAWPDFDLRDAGQRITAAWAIAEHVENFGARARVVEWDDGTPDVDISLPWLHANIWLDYTPAAPMPIISWVASAGRLFVPAYRPAWFSDTLVAHRKRTSTPETWYDLQLALEAGLCGGVDGTAFEQ